MIPTILLYVKILEVNEDNDLKVEVMKPDKTNITIDIPSRSWFGFGLDDEEKPEVDKTGYLEVTLGHLERLGYIDYSIPGTEYKNYRNPLIFGVRKSEYTEYHQLFGDMSMKA